MVIGLVVNDYVISPWLSPQVYLGRKGTGILHEEDSEEEGKRCWCICLIISSDLIRSFEVNLVGLVFYLVAHLPCVPTLTLGSLCWILCSFGQVLYALRFIGLVN